MTVNRIIVATPGVAGADGASELARQWVEALGAFASTADATLEVWSLTDVARPPGLATQVGFTTAAGSRWRFASMAMRAGHVDEGTLVVVLHVHLLPALVPLLWRGARAVTVMLGVEVWKPLRPVERMALRRSWRVTAISAHTMARFRRENPSLASLPISVCHPRVPAAPLPDQPRLSEPSKPAARYALIVGRMSAEERYKGHDLLIDVWPRVIAAAPDAALVIAGGGDDLGRLQQRAAAAGLGERVRFVGPVPAPQLAALYRDADFFVMPSGGEGFGIVYLEAMRAGKPCIAGRGAAEEIITDGEDGVIVDPGRPDEVAAAIARLFVDAPYRERLGARAAACVARRFTPEQLAVRVADLVATPC